MINDQVLILFSNFQKRLERNLKFREYMRKSRQEKHIPFEIRHIEQLRITLQKINENITYDVNQPIPERHHNINKVLAQRRFRNTHPNYSKSYLFFDYVDKLENYFRGSKHG